MASTRAPAPTPQQLVTAADALTGSLGRGGFARDARFNQAVQLYRKAFKLGNTTGAYNLACSY
ncbi:MAG: hypothetical protein H0T79_06210, partial [Deltaproteobacteria bacterium]|nr:hypothetical protein [Deltaproteobacteria bacterium]